MTKKFYALEASNDFNSRAPTYSMEVVQDSGTHRHLKFRVGNSIIFGFDIVTWPGHLAVSGDMGCFVFSRLRDMFEFFRGRPGSINPPYWAEKLKAVDKASGFETYSPKRFRDNIMEWLTDDLEDHESVDSGLIEAVENYVLPFAEYGEQIAIRTALDFTYHGQHVFQDFYEVDCREYDYNYLWCLHAIVWAVRQYDEMKLSNGVSLA